MRYVVMHDGKPRTVELGAAGADGTRTFMLDGAPHQAHAVYLPGGMVSLLIDGRSYDFDFERPSADPLDARVNVRVRGEVFRLEVMEERKHRLRAAATRAAKLEGPGQILSPMPGKVVKVLKPAGSEVKAGEGVIVVEAMKMENELKAPGDGTVKEVRVQEGQAVDSGAVLVVIG